MTLGWEKSDDGLWRDLERMLSIESVTPNEAAMASLLEEVLRSQGYDVERESIAPGRDNLWAHRARPSLLFSTHIDTVPPYVEPRREGQTAYGRGACDTKGGILAMLHAARDLDDDRVGFLFVVGEEVDHAGAKAAARSMREGIERIILCEPTRNRVVSAQKGMLKARLKVRGVAAHSAYPERGDSALHRLIDALYEILHADWPADPELGLTTWNVGEARGGVAANVFAPSAEAVLLGRLVTPTVGVFSELERIAERYRIEVEPIAQNDPVRFDPPDGVDRCTVAFNTDASYLAELAPIWLVGPGDIEVAHTDYEHIELGELRRGIDLYAALAREALRG